MDKLKMQTENQADANYRKLAELFPNAVTETVDEDGNVIRAIDKDTLMQEINTYVVEGREERYQFTWPDKRKAILAANAPSTNTLRPCREESVNFDTTENLYIEGDNLEVLKLLQENYLGSVKMIYIDPPYNTGNDFVYEDDFAETLEEYKANSGQYDADGNRLLANTESNGRFHTDWLNMMYSRLKIARNLLSDDGVIFISIDQNEVENLLKLCSETFGYNKVELYVWDTREPGTLPKTAKKTVRNDNEFIVAVFKKECSLNKFAEQKYIDKINEWSNADNDPRGPWMSANISRGSGASTGGSKSFVITNPNGICFDRDWAISEEEYLELLHDGRIYFSDGGNGVPRKKIFATDIVESIQSSIFEKLKSATSAGQELTQMFGRKVFDFPKPIALVRRMINIAAEKDSIILDFFSGSATTAHATMLQNACDGGKRKFIMIQLPEVTDAKSEAAKIGFKTICDIGKERIRQAAKLIKEEYPDAVCDFGFRVLKLDTSNMEDVYYTPEKLVQDPTLFGAFFNNVKANRTSEDLLFQAMLELDVELSSKIETITIDGKTIFNVADNYLLACFDENVTNNTIEEIAKMQPSYFVMRDSSMANDSVAVNFEQLFKSYSPSTILKVI